MAEGEVELIEDELSKKFNCYVGSNLGILKGVCFGAEKPILKNFYQYTPTKAPPIIRLRWIDDVQKELLVGFEDQSIMIYNLKLKMFTDSDSLNIGDGKAVDLFRNEKGIVMGLKSGTIALYSYKHEKNILEYSSGSDLCRIGISKANKNIFATGGNENDLKIWDLSSPDPSQPIFKARNLSHDFLDMRIPVWVQDITFMPKSSELVATCSKHGHIRMYDSKVTENKGRPVVNITFSNEPLQSISATKNDKQVIVGSGRGKVALFDLRNTKNSMVHMFRGFTGSVRSIDGHPELPYFASCSLDAFLYLHHIDMSKPLKKLYLKSELNSVVITNEFHMTGQQEEQMSSNANDSMDQKQKVVWHNLHDQLNVNAKRLKTDS